SLVTSDGTHFCVATYALSSPTFEARGCSQLRAEGVARLGQRLAFVEAHVDRPPPPPTPPLAPRLPPPTSKRSPAAHPARHPPVLKASKHGMAVATKRAPKLKADILLRGVDERGAFDASAKAIGVRFERPLEGMTLVGAAPRPDGIQLAWYEWDPG